MSLLPLQLFWLPPSPPGVVWSRSGLQCHSWCHASSLHSHAPVHSSQCSRARGLYQSASAAYHGSCYVNVDHIVCQVLLFLIRNQHTVYRKVPVTSLHHIYSLFDVLHTQTNVCNYNYVLRILCTYATTYVLHWWLAELLCDPPDLSSSYHLFSLPDIHVRRTVLLSAGSTHFPEHRHGTGNRNRHTPVFWSWWSPCFDYTHNM